ncbi:hypothetical protein ACFC6U_01925 [Kitasatospora purpeofusca]|uniref:hypothetical protein n=1 Tax=Kitasatospora purpeofusca TaxID=67352 RepID=UPI0035DA2C27
MPVTAEMVLAALAEFARPEPVTCRYEQGVDWAASAVRRAVADHRLWKGPDNDLRIVEPALRAWLAGGPDYDSKDYNRGCEAGQEIVRLILDRVPEAIFDYLDDAARRSARLAAALGTDLP